MTYTEPRPATIEDKNKRLAGMPKCRVPAVFCGTPVEKTRLALAIRHGPG
jgi:hypothetical protein